MRYLTLILAVLFVFFWYLWAAAELRVIIFNH